MRKEILADYISKHIGIDLEWDIAESDTLSKQLVSVLMPWDNALGLKKEMKIKTEQDRLCKFDDDAIQISIAIEDPKTLQMKHRVIILENKVSVKTASFKNSCIAIIDFINYLWEGDQNSQEDNKRPSLEFQILKSGSLVVDIPHKIQDKKFTANERRENKHKLNWIVSYPIRQKFGFHSKLSFLDSSGSESPSYLGSTSLKLDLFLVSAVFEAIKDIGYETIRNLSLDTIVDLRNTAKTCMVMLLIQQQNGNPISQLPKSALKRINHHLMPPEYTQIFAYISSIKAIMRILLTSPFKSQKPILPDLPATDLRLYKTFKKNGRVLSLAPKIKDQRDYTCGCYAIACATDFHFSKNQSLFDTPPPPARKSDTDPPAQFSVRQIAKENEISIIGEIFSGKNLGKLIDASGCQHAICKIENYQQFIRVIENAIDMDFPVILPFAIDNNDAPSSLPSGESAHWATIIGYKHEKSHTLLVAQFGEYSSAPSEQYYKAFFDITPYYPGHFFIKKEESNIIEWTRPSTKPHVGTIKDVKEVPRQSLRDFRRKLVVVMPPGFDLALWDQRLNPPASSPVANIKCQ